MDNQIKSQGRVRPIFAYIKESVKFYDLENPVIAQVVFLVQLVILFGGYWFARPYTQDFSIVFEQMNVRLQNQLESKILDMSFMTSELYTRMVDSMLAIFLIFIVIRSLSLCVSLFYGTYYHFSLTQPSIKGSQRALLFLRRLPKLILFNVMFYIAYFFVVFILLIITGILTLIVPFFSVLSLLLPLSVLALGALFMFKDLLIIEFDVGVFNNFKKSLDITQGCRKNVIINGLWPMCIGGIVTLFAMDVQNPMLALFISAFLEVIVLLMTQRLTVLMFADAASLERQDKKAPSNVK